LRVSGLAPLELLLAARIYFLGSRDATLRYWEPLTVGWSLLVTTACT